MDTIKITTRLISSIKKSIDSALEYEKITSRKMGITGEVGEVLVCEKLGLNLLTDDMAPGYDAVDNDGKTYQIKTRRNKSGKGRIGSFSKHKFDYALLAELDHKYQLTEIWKINYKTILPIIEENKRRNPSLIKFKSVAKKIL